MNSFSVVSKNVFISAYHLLNEPSIKEGIKNVASSITFASGVAQILQGREITTETYPSSSPWEETANKISMICARLSLVFSAGVSRPGLYLTGILVGKIFAPDQIERVFGQNTTFALNPRHPRHVLSIAAALLALPALALSIYQGSRWVYHKIVNHPSTPSQSTAWLTDTKVKWINLFNIATSRPTLHLGNRLCTSIIKSL